MVKFLIVSPQKNRPRSFRGPERREQKDIGEEGGSWTKDRSLLVPFDLFVSTHRHTLSFSLPLYHQLSLFSLVLHLVFNFRSTLRPYARFSAFSPLSFVHLFSLLPLLFPHSQSSSSPLRPDRLGKRKIHCVPLFESLSFSHSLTLSVYTRASHPLPPPYLLNIPSARDSKCGLFFFFFTGEKDQEGCGHRKGKFNERRRLFDSRGTLYYYPPPPRRIFPKTGDEKKNPFPSLPFFFFILTSNVSLSFLANHIYRSFSFFFF